VLEGDYTVRMTDGKDVQTGTIHIVPDPLSMNTPADRKAQFDLAMELFGQVEDMAYTTDRLIALRDQAKAVSVKDEALAKRAADFAAALEAQRAKYVPVKEGGGITGEERHREHLVQLYWTVAGFDGRPAPPSYERRDALKKDIAATDQECADLIAKTLGPLNEGLKAAGAAPIADLSRGDWEAKTKKPGSGGSAKGLDLGRGKDRDRDEDEPAFAWTGPVRFF
jgi:hypothetical protein